MNGNRIASLLAVVCLAAVGFLVFRGVSDADTSPPEPAPFAADAPIESEFPWATADLSPMGAMQGAVLTPGTGAPPTPDQLVEVSWQTWVESKRLQIQDTTGAPRSFVLSESPLISGLNQALVEMKPGEKRVLQIPPELAYGQTGRAPVIPRDAIVMAEITLHAVTDVAAAPDTPQDVPLDATVGTVRYHTLTPPTGAKPTAGQQARIHLTTWLPDGARINSTYDMHRPITVAVGTGQLFSGLDQLILDMGVGEKRQAVLPPEVAAGAAGRPPIPPNTPLTVQVELLAVQ